MLRGCGREQGSGVVAFGQRAVSLGKQNRSMRARIMYSAALILVGILGLRKTGVEV